MDWPLGWFRSTVPRLSGIAERLAGVYRFAILGVLRVGQRANLMGDLRMSELNESVNVNRRQFVTASAAGVCLAVLAQCCEAADAAPPGPGGPGGGPGG